MLTKYHYFHTNSLRYFDKHKKNITATNIIFLIEDVCPTPVYIPYNNKPTPAK